jgi:hypothetical protein
MSKERSKSHLPSPTKKCLPELISLDVMNNAGFNYYETSAMFPVGNDIFDVHIGDKMFRPNINIVIASRIIGRGENRKHEWHFGVFEGKKRGDTEGKETEEFDDKIIEILQSGGVVDGRTLEKKLVEIIKKHEN